MLRPCMVLNSIATPKLIEWSRSKTLEEEYLKTFWEAKLMKTDKIMEWRLAPTLPSPQKRE